MGTNRKEPERQRESRRRNSDRPRDIEKNESGTQRHTVYKETERQKLHWGKVSESAWKWKRMHEERERDRERHTKKT